MGKLHLNSDCIQDYDISLVSEQHEDITVKVIVVEIQTDFKTITYRISNNDRNIDINDIAESINAGLASAKKQ